MYHTENYQYNYHVMISDLIMCFKLYNIIYIFHDPYSYVVTLYNNKYKTFSCKYTLMYADCQVVVALLNGIKKNDINISVYIYIMNIH